MKYEIAEEMGLLDRVLSDGWKSLSAKETGRIGGLMTKRKKEKLKNSYPLNWKIRSPQVS